MIAGRLRVYRAILAISEISRTVLGKWGGKFLASAGIQHVGIQFVISFECGSHLGSFAALWASLKFLGSVCVGSQLRGHADHSSFEFIGEKR